MWLLSRERSLYVLVSKSLITLIARLCLLARVESGATGGTGIPPEASETFKTYKTRLRCSAGEVVARLLSSNPSVTGNAGRCRFEKSLRVKVCRKPGGKLIASCNV